MTSADHPKGQLHLTGVDPLEGREFSVRKRDGRIEPFNEARIHLAIENAFKSVLSIPKDHPLPESDQLAVDKAAEATIARVLSKAVRGELVDVERIQDWAEQVLMEHGHHAVARSYILYREERRKARALRGDRTLDGQPQAVINIRQLDGTLRPLDPQLIRKTCRAACQGFEDETDWTEIAEAAIKQLYDGATLAELENALILAARERVERDPAYSYVAARLLLNVVYREAFRLPAAPQQHELPTLHTTNLIDYITRGVEARRLSPDLLKFDLQKIAQALDPARDLLFNYLGIQTIYDRYLIHIKGQRIETPQYFWMRVALGLALNEGSQKEDRAIQFYHLLSTHKFISSTPTLFNAGTLTPQLSSCYLTTVMDDLDHIFKCIADDAKLSKWAGGLGNDWTNIRATGAYIAGTNGTSQGVIPFLKVANDTAVAVNQGGKRKGAMCAYLETWHLDIEDFLELRKNTGDERRRTHDMNTANWIPDLFMKRVKTGGTWTLFNPSDCPDLHDLTGTAFEERYTHYEKLADEGKITLFKRVEAVALWRKMLSMLFETGHPWITFKDPSNLRSPQQHCGVVHSSNLCTEILLNTSAEETAVCNLGSINLAAHIKNGAIDEPALAATIRTAMRMLDNVIDINYYPTPEARNANLRHRPVGLGLMGFQDALYQLGIPYASQAAVQFADTSMEIISYHAILASTELAAERGPYSTFKGSLWDQGILPIDSIAILEKERGGHLTIERTTTLDWSPVRRAIATHGMRNSNCMAIAPTATISNIIGVSQSIEPTFANLYVKGNLSGSFTVINTYLVADLKKRGLWDKHLYQEIKFYDGSVQEIDRIPDDLKELYRTAFQIEPHWLIEAASRRQKWIDMGQSLNLYIAAPSGKKLSDMYLLAWEKGLKTTYYLRSTAASTIEKSTDNRRPRWTQKTHNPDAATTQPATTVKNTCSLADPTCEACQ
jgi:ribonucleoside-diphosphate reductase alpha chain